MKIATPVFGLICLPIPASNVVTMSRWNEACALPLQDAPLGREPASLGVTPR